MDLNCSIVLDLRNFHEQVKKKESVSKIVLTFHCLSKLVLRSQKFLWITRAIFFHSRSEQFWKQNTKYEIQFNHVFLFVILFLVTTAE